MSPHEDPIEGSLSQAYADLPRPVLPADFHARLEARLEREVPLRRRRVAARILTLYWALAALASVALLTAFRSASPWATNLALLTLAATFLGPALMLGRWGWHEALLEGWERVAAPR